MEINDITYAIRGAVFEVNRVLGSGFLEKVYESESRDKAHGIGFSRRARGIISGHVGRLLSASVCG